MNENTVKWSKTGLIDENLPELDKTILASNLEEAAKELINRGTGPTAEPVGIMERKAGLFLPIIVRLFYEKKLRVIENMTALYKDFEKFYNEKWNVYKECNSYIAMDGEAQFCSAYVEQFTNE